MATVRDCPVETLIQRLDHLDRCYTSDQCDDPLHQWSLESWKVVFDRLGPWGLRMGQLDDSTRRGLPQRLFDAVRYLVRRSWQDGESIRQQNAELRSDLEQLRGGVTLRAREEIIAATQAATAITTRPRVPARAQYAAMRVAQALTWVLEAPLTGTKTGFHPERDDGIA